MPGATTAAEIYIDSNRRDPASRDTFVIDVASGKIDLVVKNPGIGSLTSVTADGRFGLLSRVQSRGNNNLHLVELSSGKDTLLTPHEGVAQYFGEIAKDWRSRLPGDERGPRSDRVRAACASTRAGSPASWKSCASGPTPSSMAFA